MVIEYIPPAPKLYGKEQAPRRRLPPLERISFSHQPIGYSHPGARGVVHDGPGPPRAGTGPYVLSRPVSCLHGVGPARQYRLWRAGIRSVGDAARMPDVQAVAAAAGLPASFVESARLKARAAAEDRIIQRRRLVMPPDDEMAIFDIETDTQSYTVWLIGVLYRGKVRQFMADGRQESGSFGGGGGSVGRMLGEFAGYLDSIRPECSALASYSGTGFDTRVTGAALARVGVEAPAFHSMRHVDVCSLLRRSFFVPGQSYSLKSLGASLGYRFSHAGMDGLDAALEYERHVARGTPISPEVLEYNRDDVMSVRHVIDSLEAAHFDIQRRSGGGRRQAAALRRR